LERRINGIGEIEAFPDRLFPRKQFIRQAAADS